MQVLGQAQASSADFARSLPGTSEAAAHAPTTPGAGPSALFAGTDQPADPALTLALVAVLALLGGLALGALAILVLGRRRT